MNTIQEQLEQAPKSRAFLAQKREEEQATTIPAMCRGCTLYRGIGTRCPIQKDPGWLWEKNRKCWSKRTDPAVDKKIRKDTEIYSGGVRK